MKRKWGKRILLIFLLLVVLVQIGAKQVAVAKLYLIVEKQIIFGAEGERDELDDSRSELSLRDKETLTTLRNLLGDKGLIVQEVTGASLKPWPPPVYYVGNTDVGGNHCFFIWVGFRSFIISLPEGKESKSFWEQIDRTVEAELQAKGK